MNPSYVKNALAVVVILFFISESVIPSTGTSVVKKSSIASFDGNTLYVGGNGPGNYTSIQDAIDNASDGDTVFVYNGTYYENIVVDKSIDLIGEDRNTTIIDGLKTYYHGIEIFNNNITILNFKIQNSHYGGIVIENSNFSKVYNNIIDTNRYGIFVWKSSNNSIYNNTVSNNWVGGIELYESHNNFVYRNVITDNRNETNYGAGVSLVAANSNIIIQNWITNNGRGIFSLDSSNNTIRENNISWNQYNGIQCLFYCNYSQIHNNVIKGNNGTGIEFRFGSSSYGNISGNLIIENNHSGIVLDESYCFNIYANHIENNSFSGLVVDYGDDNNIFWNSISNNKEFGVHLTVADNNTIRYNLIKQNKKIGLYLEFSSHNQIINNNFISNRFEAHFLLSNYNRWSGNYWNRLRFLPKLIFGRMGDFWNIPWINVDWNPAQEPYDIPTGV